MNDNHPALRRERRIKGGKTGHCVLCERRTTLRLSHIVPKWAYSWGKAEGVLVGDYKSLNVRTRDQDGTKEYLLCDKCEGSLSRAEAYFQLLADENFKRLEAYGTTQSKDSIHHLCGVKVELAKQFICGVMLKSHFCTMAPFHRVRFSESQVEILRDFLTGRSDGYPFPIIARRVVESPLYPGANPKAMVYVPSIDAIDETGFSIFMGGWEWYVFFDLLMPIGTKDSLAENWHVPIISLETYLRAWRLGPFRNP